MFVGSLHEVQAQTLHEKLPKRKPDSWNQTYVFRGELLNVALLYWFFNRDPYNCLSTSQFLLGSIIPLNNQAFFIAHMSFFLAFLCVFVTFRSPSLRWRSRIQPLIERVIKKNDPKKGRKELQGV